MKTAFNSRVRKLSSFADEINNEAIKKEPMFFNASIDFAYENGGAITRSFIDALPELYRHGVFDSRVHMLMSGWYGAIPGWHHDDVPRPPTPVGGHFLAAGQPDYVNPAYFSRHVLGLVNASVAPTEFIHNDVEMRPVPDGGLIYRQWHQEIENMKDGLEIVTAEDRTLYEFDADTFHQAVPALKTGFRWFGRVSIDTDRIKSITNEIRQNANVYLPFPMDGW